MTGGLILGCQSRYAQVFVIAVRSCLLMYAKIKCGAPYAEHLAFLNRLFSGPVLDIMKTGSRLARASRDR